MEATELRIGNRIIAKPKHGEAREIIVTPYIFSEMEVVTGVTYSGIPLTEEWLLKFGFRKKERKIDKNHNYDLNISKHYVIRVNQGEICLPYIGWTGKAFVHQLQNLYFALTGEELTITE